tara:strand:+ start:207 stop:815 length:609 start_codon:yes stop_codon:yes gene_type:complete
VTGYVTVDNRLDIPCVILAGGASRRFGTPKGLALLDGLPLVDHVAMALSAQVRGPVILNAQAGGAYSACGLDSIDDALSGQLGPLAGIHAAMRWAERLGCPTVVTAPVDTPFLPQDLVVRLTEAGAPAVAQSLGRIHGVCGLWPVKDASGLEAFLESGQRKVETWVNSIGARPVDFAAPERRDPFFNINTPRDAERAQESIG